MIAPALPPARRVVFVDSSAYLAILDRKDQYHQQATEILRFLARHRYGQVTTNALIIEAYALILSALGRDQAYQFLQKTLASKTTMIRVSAEDESRAIGLLGRYQDKDFSFTDAISFVVMERLGIPHAFTFDHHFSQYGLMVLTPEQS